MKHRLYNHDKLYYELLDSIEADFRDGKITEDERNIMKAKATLDESDLRKKDIELTSGMFGNRNAKEDDVIYYQQRIGAFIDELYISCKYSWEDTKKLRRELDYIVDNSKEEGKRWYDLSKKIYNDIISGKISIDNFNGENILKMYEV